VESIIHFKEDFFYNDPLKEAYHSFLFFYLCRPLTLRLLDDSEKADGEVEKPTWYDLKGLRENDFQSHGEILGMILQRVSLTVTEIG
jgi:hypothetical protein